ncbi:MAG: DUF2017 family protein [Acidimicrobiia bacterium]
MIFRSKPPIRRSDKGVVVDLSSGERDLLQALVMELRHRIGEDGDAEDLRRLFPTAYHDDPQRDAEYQILARSELTDRRLGAIETMLGTVGAQLLSHDEAQCWLTTVNQLRLVLGTRLDISEDDDEERLDPADPEAQERLIYHWLTGVLALLVDASLT